MGVNRKNEQAAIQLMKQHIHSEWISTTMGSGFQFVLKDTYGSVIHEHKYLDIFELPDDLENASEQEKQEYPNKVRDLQSKYFEEWRATLKEESFQKFVGLCEVKWLHYFI